MTDRIAGEKRLSVAEGATRAVKNAVIRPDMTPGELLQLKPAGEKVASVLARVVNAGKFPGLTPAQVLQNFSREDIEEAATTINSPEPSPAWRERIKEIAAKNQEIFVKLSSPEIPEIIVKPNPPSEVWKRIKAKQRDSKPLVRTSLVRRGGSGTTVQSTPSIPKAESEDDLIQKLRELTQKIETMS